MRTIVRSHLPQGIHIEKVGNSVSRFNWGDGSSQDYLSLLNVISRLVTSLGYLEKVH